jgi:hypothetical protein
MDSFRFTDSALDADFNRALELIGKERDHSRTTLELSLPGTDNRFVTFGYVSSAPVWKAAYRLDLSAKVPFLQGWAVVDNATDGDWRGVSLSLVSGRPVSFIQELYDPVYVRRPVIPLAIAGTAAPREYAEGIAADESAPLAEAEAPRGALMAAAPVSPPSPKKAQRGLAGSFSSEPFQAASALPKGDQFEFTVGRPVDLERGRSALLPLVSTGINASRVSIYTAGSGKAVLGARLENSTGMKLPAGPVTVFDDGLYAGDALLGFFSEKESRLIAFGEDLALVVDESIAVSTETVGVNLSKGALVFSRRRSVSKTYTFRNADAGDKRVIIEHPETAGAALSAPGEYVEKADGKYRFRLDVASGQRNSLVVVERVPAREAVSLSSLNADAFFRYASSGEIPAAVREALGKAAALRRKAEDAARTSRDVQAKKAELAADQGRIRDNIESVGKDTAEGKKYVQRLLEAETEIDRLTALLETSRSAAAAAQAEFEEYIAALTV